MRCSPQARRINIPVVWKAAASSDSERRIELTSARYTSSAPGALLTLTSPARAAFRHFLAFFSRFGKTDGDRLLAAFHPPAAAAFAAPQLAAIEFLHLALDVPRCRSRISSCAIFAPQTRCPPTPVPAKPAGDR